MPSVGPLDCSFDKQVNRLLRISAKYVAVANDPRKLDLVVEFSNTDDPTHRAETPGEGEPQTDTQKGWFRLLWTSENSRLVDGDDGSISLLLGYAQLLGCVRLNHQIGADGASDAQLAVYWRNGEYVEKYWSKDMDEKLQQVTQTEFLSNFGGEKPAQGHLEGIPDLAALKFDPTSHYLLHDLLHPFGTLELPLQPSPMSDYQQSELASSLKKFITPFYVTAQHLMFPSLALAPGKSETFRLRVDLPPDSLPPSYNAKLTGSVGEAALTSIIYNIVVGLQEEVDGQLTQRAVYFPIEFRPGNLDIDGSWRQHNYLSKPIVDQAWLPSLIENKSSAESQPPKSAAEPEDEFDPRFDTFMENLDTLIDGTIDTLTAKERRKSSVTHLTSQFLGLILQNKPKLRATYQIRVNTQTLCDLTLSNAHFHVGDDIAFDLRLHLEPEMTTRMVGFTAHLEAHEIYHLPSDRKIVNIYKVTPSIKFNAYADALMYDFGNKAATKLSNYINIPSFLTQQFQSSTFMDLKYFMVFKFVINEFEGLNKFMIDADTKQFADYIQAYKLENESSEFKFSIPLAILPQFDVTSST